MSELNQCLSGWVEIIVGAPWFEARGVAKGSQ
jgi:hypothetical protein